MQLTERRRGNECFNRGDLDQAMWHYKRAKSIVDLLQSISGITHRSEQEEIDENKATVNLNIAAVHLRSRHYSIAAESCSTALSIQPQNVKGLIRRAKCFCFMHEYEVSI